MDVNEKEEIQNTYASNVEDNIIHISEAESGRKGYFCLGCKREMQAVISKMANRISYFRHDFTANKGLPKCTYSDETYRHKLAKEILLRLKMIKVPALYKYPPKNIEGQPVLIEESKYVTAHHVEQELSFFENEEGVINWNKTINIANANLLVRPDIIFFNAENKPILFIEIVATHKLTESKILSLKRIGIDTIQVTIPKDSPESIEKTFTKTNRTKWIYNYEQESREYIPVPSTDSKGISPIDEEQRLLFEESVKCRTAQINNLIRSITRCLESEQHTKVRRRLESEIHRVERNTEAHRKILSEHRRKQDETIDRNRSEIKERVFREFADEEGIFKNEEKYFGKEETDFNREEEEFRNRYNERIDRISIAGNQYHSKMETRYLEKRSGLESEQGAAEFAISELGKRIESIRENVIREQRISSELRTKIELFRNDKEQIESEYSGSEGYIKGLLSRRESLERKFEGLRKELDGKFESEGIILDEKYGTLTKNLENSIKTRDFEGVEYSGEFKELLKDLGQLYNYSIERELCERYRKAYDCITSGAYKDWKK